jgi:NTP pyrophosphatase (non-canonical NTP hydrolase)
MEIKHIQEFSKREHARLKRYYNFDDEKKMNLPITVKIMEELGELSNEVLAHSNLQRKEKMDKFHDENLAEEFADVILTTFNLAENMGVDLEKGLKSKMEKINQRYDS